MSGQSFGRGVAAALLLAASGWPVAALAQTTSPPTRAVMVQARSLTARPAYVCDRATFRACQGEAKLQVQACEAFSGRLACVDRALTELEMCWRATGCW